MLMRGWRTLVHYLQKSLPLVILLSLALLIYTFLKKMTTSQSSNHVYNLLLLSGLNDTLSRFATAQAAHETAGFTSAIYKSNNNICGMKYAGQVNSIGEKNGYANYNGVENSVADLVAWYTRKRTNILSLPLYINSLESYVKFLKNNNYFEASESEYLKGCAYWYKQIFG